VTPSGVPRLNQSGRLTPLLWFALAGGIFFHFVFFLLFHLEWAEPRAVPPRRPLVSFPEDRQTRPGLYREQARFLDSAPLFLPTRVSTAANYEQVGGVEEAARLFGAFGPRLVLPDYGYEWSGKEAGGREEELSLTEAGAASLFLGLGRELPPETKASVGTAGFLIESTTREGEVRREFAPLPEALRPDLPGQLWEPMVWRLHRQFGRLQGPPILENGSGNTVWDEVVGNFLAESDFTLRLGSGYHRIEVFP